MCIQHNQVVDGRHVAQKIFLPVIHAGIVVESTRIVGDMLAAFVSNRRTIEAILHIGFETGRLLFDVIAIGIHLRKRIGIAAVDTHSDIRRVRHKRGTQIIRIHC